MHIKEQILADIKSAMKAREQSRLDALRYALSRIKNIEIDEGEQDDAGVQKILQKIVKEISESIADYTKGGREDLVASEQSKLEIMQAYLPKPLSDEELQQLIAEVRSAFPDLPFGQMIGKVMEKAAGKADGSRVAGLLKQMQN